MNNYNVLFNFHKLIFLEINISKSLIFNNKMLCFNLKNKILTSILKNLFIYN